MEQRKITEDEERAYRTCHHEFRGLSVPEAALRMGMQPARVRTLLRSLKAKAPQLFPILAYKQYRVYKMYTEEGMLQHQIAKKLGISQSSVNGLLGMCKKKGMPGIEIKLGRLVSYDNNMDDKVTRKF